MSLNSSLHNLRMSEKLNQRKYTKICKKTSDTDTKFMEQHLCLSNIKKQLTVKVCKRISCFYALVISLISNIFLGKIQQLKKSISLTIENISEKVNQQCFYLSFVSICISFCYLLSICIRELLSTVD